MIKNSQDDNSEVLESSRSPAEALRQQILKDGTVHYMTGAFIQKHYSNDTVSPIDHKVQEIVEIGIDDLLELVTAYAATVEREARIDELKQLEKQLFGIDEPGINAAIGYIRAIIAALQGPQDA